MDDLLKALLAGSQLVSDRRSLLFAEARDENRWRQINEKPFFEMNLNELRALGCQYRTQPIRTLPFSSYALFDRTGDRAVYEMMYFDRRRRMAVMAVLALCGEDKTIEALEDVIWAICEESTWCLPAHLGGKSLAVGYDPSELPAGRDPRHSLDLFACETAFTLGEILSLLGNRLCEPLVNRARQEVFERVIDSYLSPAPAYWWESCDMNWAAVCAGSIGAAAMYFIEDDQTLYPILERVLRTLECYLAGFPEDGACLEGVGYWGYGFGFFTYFALLLRQRTAGQIDLMQLPKARTAAHFLQKSFLLGGSVISYADADLTPRYIPGLSHKLAAIYDTVDPPPPSAIANWMDECGRWPIMIRNLVWSDEKATSAPLRDAYYYMNLAGVVVSRKIVAPAVAFSAKAGHNDEPHNHNDLGSFIFCVDGKNLLVDPGRGKYSRQYFGEGRYDLLCNSSRGHSVPIIDGQYQQAGPTHAAMVLESSHDEDLDLFSMELSRAYDCPALSGLVRNFMFERARGVLTLLDRYSFKKAPSSVVERLVTFQRPETVEPGRVRLSDGVACIDICYDNGKLRCVFGSEPFVTHSSAERTLYMIDLQVINPQLALSVQLTIEARLVP